MLAGGIEAWASAGYAVYSGMNVASKAFGEFVEHHYRTPHIEPLELTERVTAGEKVVLLDSRPLAEYRKMSIPGGIDCPGAELVYRVPDLVKSPEALVVVNCAGRTRSIIGAQSLINAGIPNKVVALKNGTMGWHLAGLKLAHNQDADCAGAGALGSESGTQVGRTRSAAIRRQVRDGQASPRFRPADWMSVPSTCSMSAAPRNTRRATCTPPFPLRAASSCKPRTLSWRPATRACCS